MSRQQNYKMSFSTGGLFINESVEVAKLHQPGEPWRETLERALTDRTMTQPKIASNRRSLREITTRLEMLSEDDVEFLIYADREDQVALLWVATCRAYRFVREFAVETIHERYLSGKSDLPVEIFENFFDHRAEWNEVIANISKSTRMRLRQVLFKILREANIISEENQIHSALLSTRFIGHLAGKNKDELRFFPGVYIPRADERL
jgi:hypothetical protein